MASCKFRSVADSAAVEQTTHTIGAKCVAYIQNCTHDDNDEDDDVMRFVCVCVLCLFYPMTSLSERCIF